MKNEIQVIKESELFGKQFNVYGTPEDPLFLAKDVAEWIDYDKTSINKMLNSVDNDEKLNGTIFRAGQGREMWFLTEDGLYEVLMQSRKPIAKQFKKGVKKILHEIRTQGGYIATTPEMTDLEIVSKALLISQRAIEQRDKKIAEMQLKNKSLATSNRLLQEKADNLQDLTNYYKDKARLSEDRTTKFNIECIMLTKDCKERDQTISKLNIKIENDKGKVDYYDQCNENADKTLMSFRETASLLNIKEKKLLDVLRFFNMIYGTKKGPKSMAKYLDKGYFQNVEGVADNGYQFCQTKTTIEGRRYLNDNWERMLAQYEEYCKEKKAKK